MKKFKYTVERVTGYCACGYKEGDEFIVHGMNTPDKAFCGGAYIILFPMQVALSSGGRFNFEKDPLSKGELACPDNGNVIFRITMLDDN